MPKTTSVPLFLRYAGCQFIYIHSLSLLADCTFLSLQPYFKKNGNTFRVVVTADGNRGKRTIFLQ